MSTEKCFICKSTPTSRHHITPRTKGGTDESRNMIYVCNKCHDKIEGKNWNETITFKKQFLEEQQIIKMVPKNRTILLKDKRLIEWDTKQEEWRIWEKFPGGLKNLPISEKEVISHIKQIAKEFQILSSQISRGENKG